MSSFRSPLAFALLAALFLASSGGEGGAVDAACVNSTASCSSHGHCAADNSGCMCWHGYTTYPDDSVDACNYQQKSGLWALLAQVSIPGFFGAGDHYLGYSKQALSKLVLATFAGSWMFIFFCFFRLRAFLSWLCCFRDLERSGVISIVGNKRSGSGAAGDVELGGGAAGNQGPRGAAAAVANAAQQALDEDALDFDFVVLKGPALLLFWLMTAAAAMSALAVVIWWTVDWFALFYASQTDSNGVPLVMF